MARIVLLDAGPLGLACSPPQITGADECRDRLRILKSGGSLITIPVIADYEVRRELMRTKASAALARLDRLEKAYRLVPVSLPAYFKAAEFWALLRQQGKGTAAQKDIDADAILAGVAATIGRPGDFVTVATTNVRHLQRFPRIDAQHWRDII